MGLGGLAERVRGRWRGLQDDAHIFCLPGQIAQEIGRVLDLTQDIMTAFGFDPEGFEVAPLRTSF